VSSAEQRPIIVADNAATLFLDGTVVAFRQLTMQAAATNSLDRRPAAKTTLLAASRLRWTRDP
jgi:hypothetical protein